MFYFRALRKASAILQSGHLKRSSVFRSQVQMDPSVANETKLPDGVQLSHDVSPVMHKDADLGLHDNTGQRSDALSIFGRVSKIVFLTSGSVGNPAISMASLISPSAFQTQSRGSSLPYGNTSMMGLNPSFLPQGMFARSIISGYRNRTLIYLPCSAFNQSSFVRCGGRSVR